MEVDGWMVLQRMEKFWFGRTMTNVNQAPLPRLSKAPLVRSGAISSTWLYLYWNKWRRKAKGQIVKP